MKSKIALFTLCAVLCEYNVCGLNFPGPRVYVVTPAPRILKKDEGKVTPFYYHSWMRRMDTVSEPATTTPTEKSVANLKTPDLIFAEFESDGSKQKSIRKLLEQEKIMPKKTTMTPIYVPDDEEKKISYMVKYGLPVNYTESSAKLNKYPYMSQDNYYNNFPGPMYVTPPSTALPTVKITSTTFSSNNIKPSNDDNIQNIWQIFDSEKSDEYSSKWKDVSFDSNNEKMESGDGKNHRPDSDSSKQEYDAEEMKIDDNFALPGFATNPGNDAENESRAIRNEQNIRFPYINLKPFQLKPVKPPSGNGKKSNLYTNLDNFYDLKNPVRGEAQDIVPSSPPIDRYNPAQPYLPQQKYGPNLAKQSSPPKATASLVPPPPPPQIGNDFPIPTGYESFPPYIPSPPVFGPAPASTQQQLPPVSVSMTPSKTVDYASDFGISDTSSSDDDRIMGTGYHFKVPPDNDDGDTNSPIMNTGYHYKPSSTTPQFYPTLSPTVKPFQGYSYNKPSIITNTPVADKPEIKEYHYNKPVYHKPNVDSMPPTYGDLPTYSHDIHSDTYDHNDISSHVYDHDDTSLHVEEHDDSPPDVDMTYDKPYGDVSGDNMGMKPPALETDVKPGSYESSPNDHGFPSDFPTDFKFHPDFDDHHHDHEHEHYHIIEHPTTTTETPRVNRFSYYYLGKKLYYLPLYFSVYFIVYVGALIIKAVLRHKIVYPNSWRPNTTTATFFSKRSVDEYLSHENLHGLTTKVTNAIARAAEKYMNKKEN